MPALSNLARFLEPDASTLQCLACLATCHKVCNADCRLWHSQCGLDGGGSYVLGYAFDAASLLFAEIGISERIVSSEFRFTGRTKIWISEGVLAHPPMTPHP